MSDELSELSRGLTDEDPAVREESAMGLAELKLPKAAPFLLHALDDDSEMVRMWGAYGLGMLRRKEDLLALRGVLEKDDSPLVRLWAAFGLLHAGDRSAAAQLASFLDDPSLDVRNNAADAILSLEDPAPIQPNLEKRLGSSDERARVWAAGILHRLQHPKALELWRAALVSPRTRVDAAVVAPHLEDPAAGKHLLRLLAELGPDELDGLVAEAGDRPLAELLSAPLLNLGLDQLFELATEDGATRADLLAVLARSPAIDPEVLESVSRFVSEQPAAQVGDDLAQLLAEQDPNEHVFLLANIAEYAPKAVLGAVDAMEVESREQLFDQLANAIEAQREESYLLLPLLDLLKQSPYAAQFESVGSFVNEGGRSGEHAGDTRADEEAPAEGDDLPSDDELAADFGDEEALEDEGAFDEDAPGPDDDMVPLVERLVAGEKLSAEEKSRVDTFLKEIDATPEEFLEQLALEEGGFEEPPPEGFDVALRALALAGLLQRYVVEQALKTKQIDAKEAAKEVKDLQTWMEQEGITELLSEVDQQRLAAKPGAWTDEDRIEASWSAEALAMLVWALNLGKLPPVDQPVELGKVVGAVPLFKATQSFVEKAQVRAAEELEPQRELWEMYQWRAEQETLARDAAAGRLGEGEGEMDPEALVADLAQEGFDAKAAEKKLGRNGMIAAALRFVAKQSAQRLEEDGLLKRVGGDFPFRGKPFELASEDELSRMASLASERHRALQWLTLGGPWGDEVFEETFEDEEGLDEEGLDEEGLDEELDEDALADEEGEEPG